MVLVIGLNRMNKLSQALLSLPRLYKSLISLSVDIFLLIFSFFFAYWTRLGTFDYLRFPEVYYVLSITLPVTIIFFNKLGLYQAILRYITLKSLVCIIFGAILSSLALFGSSLFFDSFIPRTIPFIYGAYVFILCSGVRILFRYFIDSQYNQANKSVLIYGAGATGRQLATLLRQANRYKIEGFIDDDETLHNTQILGRKVFQSYKIKEIISQYNISKILLAIPSASRSQRKIIIDSLISLKVEVKTIPDMEDILQGRLSLDQIKDIDVNDLLGRDPVAPNKQLMSYNITNKIVMVTGAGGSIGSELCRQIIKSQPKALILFEISEFSLYAIHQDLTNILNSEQIEGVQLIPIIGNVQNYPHISRIMKTFCVETIYHAAAYKHVPLVEFNIIEGVKNNIFGTYSAVKAAIENNVNSFVLVSTDKAVRPTNIMGTTKRMAELCLQAFASEYQNTTFSMVRFGNVLGSSGSVIPLFKKQIENGGPITVTDPRIIRYFMTIPEAAQLVIQAGAMAKGGDVFILDMGEPVKILDLAKNVVRLSGLSIKDEDNPDGDIEITFTGLRPGEKLYEELLIGDDNVQPTKHSRIMTANETYLRLSEFNLILNELNQACDNFEHEKIKDILLSAPTQFNPTSNMVDYIYIHSKSL